MRRRGEAGVTLIELLIAVMLVAFLSLGMLIAIRVGLNAMEKVDTRFTMNRRVTSVQRIIESEIGSMIPVVSSCAGAGGARFAFFEGRPQALRFVSGYSLQEAARGYPRILSYEVARGEEGVRLLVNEAIYPGPISAGVFCRGITNGPLIESGGANPQSFVLADKLAYCRFWYRRPVLSPADDEKWVPEWTDSEHLPTAIRIEMMPLNPDPARLQVMPITVPIHLTKWVLGPYED